jgi:hypothetical protein
MKVEIYVPDSLSEITLGQYQKYLSIAEGKEQDLFVQQKMVEIFCRINLKDVANIKYSSLQTILQHFQELFNQDYQLVERFEMNGIEYGFIPKLDDITFGEYVTIDSYLGDQKNLHKIMEVLYRPIKNKTKNLYSIEKYEGNKYDMKDMPLDAVFGSLVFFYRLGKELLKVTQNYLVKQMEKTIVERQHSEKNGDGTNQSLQLAMETLENLKTWKQPTFINV